MKKRVNICYKYSANLFLTILVPFILCTLIGCVQRGTSTIPDAPPPYPSFPIPQERFQSSGVYDSQNQEESSTIAKASSIAPQFETDTEAVKINQNASSFDYIPPKSIPPRSTNSANQFTANSRVASPALYTLIASGELWTLVQDRNGKEIDWIKMKAGEQAFIHDKNAAVLTCSSGNELSIKDSSGKLVSFNPKSNGISIIRLP